MVLAEGPMGGDWLGLRPPSVRDGAAVVSHVLSGDYAAAIALAEAAAAEGRAGELVVASVSVMAGALRAEDLPILTALARRTAHEFAAHEAGLRPEEGNDG